MPNFGKLRHDGISGLCMRERRWTGFLDGPCTVQSRSFSRGHGPVSATQKYGEPVKHLRMIGMGLGRPSRRCRLGIRRRKKTESTSCIWHNSSWSRFGRTAGRRHDWEALGMMGSAKRDYGWIGKATVELTRAERSSGGCGGLRRFGHVSVASNSVDAALAL